MVVKILLRQLYEGNEVMIVMRTAFVFILPLRREGGK